MSEKRFEGWTEHHSGTYYRDGTPQGVIDALERARLTDLRVRVFFGDPETKTYLPEEHDTIGYVGRSMGPLKVPLLVHNSRSTGGCGVWTENVVRVVETRTKRVLYNNLIYSAPVWKVDAPPASIGGQPMPPEYVAGVYIRKADGSWSNYANFTSHQRAMRWALFIAGERMRT